ncbi:MAG: class I SAM-dependent RNA methyltransferase [Alcaligenaceae bacterium]|nr:class I SAM-dependent RNA methyltransferase [Alcaligenaceae bacterium]
MTDSKPRKTLTLKKKAPAADTRSRPEEQEPRLRSGARARQVAQQRREQEAEAPTAAPARAPRSAAARHAQPPTSERAEQGRAGRQTDFRAARRQQPARDALRPSSRSPAREPAPQRMAAPRNKEIFQVFAPCPLGLEDVLHAELDALGYQGLRKGRAGCHFEADWTGVLKANLYSRLATRILVRLAHAPVQTEDDILELARNTEWERWFGAEQTLRVDTSAVRSPMKSLQYCNLRAKDGICDRLRDLEGERPSIDTVRPDARVHLFLDEHTATLYLDTSGESLFKRGWRLQKGEAPLRENLAAGLLALSDWDPSAALLDPFCGSGTLLIEAAWIALGIPAGIWRPFGFERLRDHDARHWRDIKQDARSRIATRLDAPLLGYDIDPRVIAAAEGNRERAMLSPDTIRFVVGDARKVKPDCEPGWIITNPPYGERMEEDASFWPQWAENLKRHYAGWNVNIITSNLELPSLMRLKPRRRHPVYNGALDCRLFSFEMVEKSYRN